MHLDGVSAQTSTFESNGSRDGGASNTKENGLAALDLECRIANAENSSGAESRQSDNCQLSILERVAALEERTKPKPKTAADRLKDWGGVASLVIALAYSFPIGVWDRFIEPEKKRAAAEMAELRRIIEESTLITGEAARALSSIQDPFLYDTVARAFNTRLYLLMTKYREPFYRNAKSFTTPELLIIGNNYVITNQTEAAQPFFLAARDRADSDIQSRVEANRQLAKMLFIRGPLQDQERARRLFDDALDILRSSRTMQSLYGYATVISEWALFELLDGDWACGQEKLALARRALADLAPFLNDSGNLARLVEQRTNALVRGTQQPAQGCD